MSDVELRQLLYFAEVAQDGSFTGAAQRLRIAQSALSRQIRDLEVALGVELLTRGAGGARPTAAGRAALAGARRALAQASDAVRRARLSGHGLAGRLVVGVGRASLGRDVVRRGLAAVRAHLPDVELYADEVEAGPSQWDQLRQGTLDLAIGLEPPAAMTDLHRDAYLDSSLDSALLPAGHPLARLSSLEPADLSCLTMLWIPRERHPDLTDALSVEVARLRIASPIDVEYFGAHALRLAVAAGRGWTPIPAFVGEWPPEGTVTVPIAGFHVPLRDVILRRADDDRPLVRRTIAILRAVSRGEPLPLPAVEDRIGREAPEITLRQLRAIVAVGAAKSAPAAAKHLGITQSALSRQLRDLERGIGVSLFDRPRLARLTPAGASLVADAAALLHDIQQMAAEASRAHRLRLGRCVISGVELTHVNPMVQRILRACEDREPQIEIILEELPTAEQVSALRSARIDLAIATRGAGAAFGAEIDRLPVSEHTLDAALLPPSHPLAARRAVRLTDLAGLPFLFMGRDAEPLLFDQVMREFEAAGGPVPAMVAVGSTQAARALVAIGRGWTLGVRRRRKRPPGALVAVPLRGIAVLTGLDLLSRHNEQNETVRAILTVASDVVARGGRRRVQP